MLSTDDRNLLDELLWEFVDCDSEDENSLRFSIYDKIMSYIDSLEIFPCDIGDTVYVAVNSGNNKYDITKTTVVSMHKWDRGEGWVIKLRGFYENFRESDFGKTIFINENIAKKVVKSFSSNIM